MVKSGRYYFLSRPRRFGNSLLISTLEAYFLGKKELFQGLAMEQLEKEWKQYPVLHLDLNIGKYDSIIFLFIMNLFLSVFPSFCTPHFGGAGLVGNLLCEVCRYCVEITRIYRATAQRYGVFATLSICHCDDDSPFHCTATH